MDKDISLKETVEESHEANESSLQSLKIAEGSETTDPAKKSNKAKKYDILLKPTGSAPIMKQKKWAVEGTKTIGSISQFIKKYIKVEAQEKLFLYVNQTFAPSPDQTIKNLYDCYASEGGLVLHYCKTPAWG